MDVLRVVRARGGVVVAAHVVVDVEVPLGPLEDRGHVAGDPGLHAHRPDEGDGARHLAGAALGHEVIHHAAVDVAGDGAAARGPAHAGLGVPDLRAGLGEPLELPAVVAVFEQHAHDVEVGAGDEPGDAEPLGLEERLLDPGHRVVVDHPLVALEALVREAAEGVRAEQQPREPQVADRRRVHGGLLGRVYGNPLTPRT